MILQLIALGSVAALSIGLSVGSFQETGTEVDLESLLPASTQDQSVKDRELVSLGIDLNDHNLAVDDLRSVGSDGTADYWITGKDSQVCLAGYIPGEDWVFASTCSTVSEFYRQGIGLELGKGEGSATEAYLLPADIDEGQIVLPRGASIFSTVESEGAVLFSVDPSGQRPEKTRVERENGIDFQLLPLTHPEK